MEFKFGKVVAEVNLRPEPNTKFPPYKMLTVGEQFEIVPLKQISAEGYTWQAAISGDKAGWLITRNISLPNSFPVPAKTTGWGLHFFDRGADIIPMAKRLKDAGQPMSSVVVINRKDIANELLKYVDYVVFRVVEVDGNPDNPDGNEWANGKAWFNGLIGKYAGLDPRVYLQMANECEYDVRGGQFWLDAMKAADSAGRKLAIFGDAVGNPSGQDYLDKWKTRTEALTYAKANNHVVVLHVYSAEGTPPGQLSGDLRPYFEGRHIDYYKSVPESAHAKLIIGEAAREFKRGKFDGVKETVDWAKALHEYYKPYFSTYLVGVCLWSAGRGMGWEDCSIDTALTPLEGLFRGSL